MNDNEKFYLDKIFTRSFNFPVVEGYSESLLIELPKIIDFYFSKTLFLFKNGILEVYRNKNESINKLVPHILHKINNNEFNPKLFLQDYFSNIKILKEYINKYKEFNFVKDNFSEMVVDLKKFKEIWIWCITGMVVVYWLAYIAIENKNELNDLKYLFDDFKKARQDSEEMYYLGNQFFDYFINYIAKKENINYKLADYLTFIEIVDYLNKKTLPNLVELSRRQSGIGFINGEKFYYKDSDIKKIISDNNIIIKDEDYFDDTIKVITGICGYKGMVKGPVKILKHHKDLDNLQDNDILVSVMTSPLYLKAVKRSAAIITDEGGVLCHAAIIARELKKPCVIGTKIATKILHDGDLVEVDAGKGIIKIIS